MRSSITKRCEELKLIQKIAPGIWIFKSQLSAALKNLDSAIYNEIGKKLDFTEAIFPKLLPVKYFRKYGKSFYPTSIAFRFYKSDFDNEQYILDPATTSFYTSYSKLSINDSELPIKIADLGVGVSFRKEDLKMIKEFCRAREYYKKEFLFIGYPKQVEEIHRSLLNKLNNFLKGMDFFTNYLEGNTLIGGKPFTTTEINIACNKLNLEVASAGIREDLILSHYGIKSLSGKKLWSGFLSIGLTRLIFCLIDKYGFDTNKWPK